MATLTVYSEPTPGNSTTSGIVFRGNVDETFSTIRSSAGNSVANLNNTVFGAELDASATTNQFSFLKRGFVTFNTFGLSAAANISAVTLSIYGNAKTNGLGTPDMHVAGVTLGNPYTLVTSDFAKAQTTSFGSISYASFSTTGYNDISLNASGIAAINKVGFTEFSIQLSWDILNNFSGTWSASPANSQMAVVNGNGVSSQRPKLTITYEQSALFGNYAPLIRVGNGQSRNERAT